MFEVDGLESSTSFRVVQHVITRCCAQKPASCGARILSSDGPLPHCLLPPCLRCLAAPGLTNLAMAGISDTSTLCNLLHFVRKRSMLCCYFCPAVPCSLLWFPLVFAHRLQAVSFSMQRSIEYHFQRAPMDVSGFESRKLASFVQVSFKMKRSGLQLALCVSDDAVFRSLPEPIALIRCSLI